MGCFGSRFDKRCSVADDLNTVCYQFVGGEANENDYCPIDKIAFKYGDEKEPAEWAKVAAGMKATDEELGKKVALELDAALTAHAKWLDSEFGTPDKAVYVGGKYELKDAKAQIAAVKAHLRDKCNNVGDYPADEVKEEPAAEEMMMEMMEEAAVEMEGGDEMDMMMAKEDLYASDSGAYEGWENLPALILRNYVVNPYFGDLIKRDIIAAEFKPSSPKHKEFVSAAVMVGMALDATESAEKDIHFAGYLGEEDIASLKGIEENGNILFPGVVAAWASEEEATKHGFNELHGKNAVSKVCFHAKTKVHSSVVCREFVYRFNAKVEKQEDKDGVLHITLADDSWEHKTLEAWGTFKEEMKKKAEEAAAAAAAAAAAMGVDMAADKVEEGAEMAMDMMDPPAAE
jgi:hypothetical protein